MNKRMRDIILQILLSPALIALQVGIFWIFEVTGVLEAISVTLGAQIFLFATPALMPLVLIGITSWFYRNKNKYISFKISVFCYALWMSGYGYYLDLHSTWLQVAFLLYALHSSLSFVYYFIFSEIHKRVILSK